MILKNSEISDIKTTDLQDEIIFSVTIEEYKKEESKRMKSDLYMNIIAVYNSSMFKILKVFSEQRLIWLKMILDWF